VGLYWPWFLIFLVALAGHQGQATVDQNCITSQGPGTALEFALTLVEKLYDPQRREEVAAPMCIPG